MTAANQPTPFVVTEPTTVQRLVDLEVCDITTPGRVVCTLTELAPETPQTFTLLGTVAETVPNGAVLVNKANVRATEPDPDTSNNNDVAATTILRQADLSIPKAADPSPVVPGTTVTFTLTVTNNGPSSQDGFQGHRRACPQPDVPAGRQPRVHRGGAGDHLRARRDPRAR